MPNLELYRIFYIVAINQNITKASEQLHISQPAITKHIKNLEEILGVSLFIRTRKGVFLTDIGQKIFIEVKNALNILTNVEQQLKIYKDNDYGVIRIGISKSLVRFYLLDHLNSFREKYPNVKIEINTDPTITNIKLLQSGLLDLIICKLPEQLDKDLEFIKLGETSYEFIVNKNLYNKIKDDNSLDNLIKYPLLLQKSPANSYTSAQKLFKNNHINWESKFNIGSASLLIDFAKIGYGIGFTTKLYVEKDLQNKNLLLLKTNLKMPKIDYGIITLKNNILTTCCVNFINLLKQKND